MAKKKKKPNKPASLPADRAHPGGADRALSGSLVGRMFAPVDITFLVYFRITFGLLVLWLGGQYFSYGMIERYYIEPPAFFTYPGFGWVKPWPDLHWLSANRGSGVYLHLFLLTVLLACIVVGFCYRLSAALFCLGFTHVFLIEQARFVNHYYLLALLSFLLVLAPAHRAFSLDALMRPKIRSKTAPAWTLRVLQLQFGIVYFFGAVTKCHGDWIGGEPVRTMMSGRIGNVEYDWIGYLFTSEHLFGQEWLVMMMIWGGLLFDLIVYPMLLWRKTRVAALIFSLAFHLTNTQIFFIDIFPWLMLSATVILFFPDWLPFSKTARADASLEDGPTHGLKKLTSGQKTMATVVGMYVAIQLLMPLRPFIYSGSPSWNNEGDRFSWRMMARTVGVKPPVFKYKFRTPDGTLVEQSGTPFTDDPDAWSHHWQFRKMVRNPDMILQFVHLQVENLRNKGYRDIEVRAIVQVSLNKRKFQDLIKRDWDLAKEPRRFFTPYPFVEELTEPFPPVEQLRAAIEKRRKDDVHYHARRQRQRKSEQRQPRPR